MHELLWSGGRVSWQAASFAILALVLAGAFLWYERRRPPARVLALVAALAALAVVGRLAFAAIPNVKPTTDIVLFAGYALGGVPGFVVGAVTALVSNIFLSQGPWTAWQMVGWGAVGAGGALLAKLTRGRELGRLRLALICGLAGFAFGAWMDAYQWTLAARQDLPTYLVISGSSLPYNAAHAIGNVIFCLLIGPAFVRALVRYRRRFEVQWAPRATHVGAAAAVVATLALALGASASIDAEPAHAGTSSSTTSTTGESGAAAKSPAARAVAYLRSVQNADGGFGGAPKQGSTELHSGWVALGLAAAGHNARDLKRRHGRTLASYVKRGAGSLADIGETERTALVAATAGFSLHSFGGHDLTQEILGQRGTDGSISNQVSYTAFGVLALRAAGQPAGASTIAWLLASQNEDGGFGLVRGGVSDVDLTGVVLEALAVVGRSSGAAAQRAVTYLGTQQNDDGGFGQRGGDGSNAQSTAYVVQGLTAVGGGSSMVAFANRYLVGLQRSDGSIAYSSTSRQTPVWVTAQALMALRRAPLPLASVPRKPKPKPKAAANELGIGGGAAAPGGGASSAGSATPVAPATPAPPASPRPVTPKPSPTGGQGLTPALPTPLSVPTPDANPADAASARRAAAGAGDDGVGPGEGIGIGLAVLALLALLWLLRRRMLMLGRGFVGVARRGATLVPSRLRRSS
jgi:hypothetical protein